MSTVLMQSAEQIAHDVDWRLAAIAVLVPAIVAGLKKVFDAWFAALARKADQMWREVDEHEDTCDLGDAAKAEIVEARVQPSLLPKGVSKGTISNIVVAAREKMTSDPPASE